MVPNMTEVAISGAERWIVFDHAPHWVTALLCSWFLMIPLTSAYLAALGPDPNSFDFCDKNDFWQLMEPAQPAPADKPNELNKPEKRRPSPFTAAANCLRAWSGSLIRKVQGLHQNKFDRLERENQEMKATLADIHRKFQGLENRFHLLRKDQSDTAFRARSAEVECVRLRHELDVHQRQACRCNRLNQSPPRFQDGSSESVTKQNAVPNGRNITEPSTRSSLAASPTQSVRGFAIKAASPDATLKQLVPSDAAARTGVLPEAVHRTETSIVAAADVEANPGEAKCGEASSLLLNPCVLDFVPEKKKDPRLPLWTPLGISTTDGATASKANAPKSPKMKEICNGPPPNAPKGPRAGPDHGIISFSKKWTAQDQQPPRR